MLTIITMTAGTREEWLRECIESVRRSADSRMVHTSAHCSNVSEWAECRLGLVQAADELFAFVDDDDLVLNGALAKCLQAMEQTGAGVAFTREQLIRPNSEPGHVYDTTPTRLGQAADSPLHIHHLAVVRRSAVDLEEVRRAIDEAGLMPTGAGLDWAIKTSAAAHGGAVHVPVVGYGWRQHGQQLHLQRDRMLALARVAGVLKPRMRLWLEGRENEPIPIWTAQP